MRNMNRILIVDDHALFRGAVRDLLSQEPDIRIVGEAGNLREALHCVEAYSPDLVLTDLAMPDARGIDAVTELKRHYPDVKIVVVSFHRENEYKRGCRRAGAVGYVVKDAIGDELREGIRAVLGGKAYMGADAAEAMFSDYVADIGVASVDASCLLH